MSRETRITRARGGADERTIPAGDVVIPDLWHLAMELEHDQDRPQTSAAVLETWHLCHDLLKHITGAEINPSPCALCNGLGVCFSESGGRAPCECMQETPDEGTTP